jgi:hypothetical protein
MIPVVTVVPEVVCRWGRWSMWSLLARCEPLASIYLECLVGVLPLMLYHGLSLLLYQHNTFSHVFFLQVDHVGVQEQISLKVSLELPIQCGVGWFLCLVQLLDLILYVDQGVDVANHLAWVFRCDAAVELLMKLRNGCLVICFVK